MADQPRIITDSETLQARYHELGAGDRLVGRIRLRPSEESMLLDLQDRGVLMMPPAVAQSASRSKAMQTRLFGWAMVPLTLAVHDLHDLLAGINLYGRHHIGKVVTKADRSNAGRGILLWNSVEEVYTQASLAALPFPFILQPFVPDCRDIRVVVIDAYLEAYRRHNPHGFRHNLHWGGESAPCDLEPEQEQLCRRVMERGRFPYGHLDLMVSPEGETWLSEINLRGGIRGARIGPEEYQRRVEEVHGRWLGRGNAGER